MALRPGLQNQLGAATVEEEQATISTKPRKRGRRGGRRRGKSAQIAAKAHRVAEDRRVAYGEGERPNLTQQLTTDLRGLYAAGREEDAGTMEPGSPKTSGAFRLT